MAATPPQFEVPGGRALVMLYNKDSFNYHVRIMLYMRARVLGTFLRRAGHWKQDRAALASRGMRGLRGNDSADLMTFHYENLLREGPGYLKASNFIHHCTDGPECPFAFAYSHAEVKQLFADFSRVELRVAHFPLQKSRWGRLLGRRVERALASRIGWYMFIDATK